MASDGTSHIIVLAAGQGKRMRSRVPKVLHPVLFQPMLHHVLDLAEALPHRSICVVVGPGHDDIRESCRNYRSVRFAVQAKPLGTGDAARAAMAEVGKGTGSVLILNGDVIALRKETLEGILAGHAKSGAAATLATCHLDSPWGYGRILRDTKGAFSGVREERDCSPEERAIREINCGIYCVDAELLRAGLAGLEPQNAQGEYYLTDIFGWLLSKGSRVDTFSIADSREALGINDREALWQVERLLRDRVNRALMLAGVTLHNPESTYIDPKTEIAEDVEIEGECRIVGSRIGRGTRIESGCRLTGVVVGENVVIKQGTYAESSEIGDGSSVGPYAHLRPGTKLAEDVKIGNFVELKKATIGRGSKASHLSYLGDAKVGSSVNVGCGFVTCNYDGRAKHETIIEDEVFIGSDSQTVAPVTLGRGSYVASGTTVTKDVPADSLVFSRGRQVTKPGYARKYKERAPKETKRSR